MINFLTYQAIRLIYFIILMIPMAFIGKYLRSLPSWAVIPVAVLTIAYFIYASVWAKKASQLFVFEASSFIPALKEARIELNMDIAIRLRFIPVLGSFLSRSDESMKQDNMHALPKTLANCNQDDNENRGSDLQICLTDNGIRVKKSNKKT